MPHEFSEFGPSAPPFDDGRAGGSCVDKVVGGRLKALREARGLSANALAEQLGLPPGWLDSYEAGARRVPAATLIAVARILKVGFAEIYGNLDR